MNDAADIKPIITESSTSESTTVEVVLNDIRDQTVRIPDYQRDGDQWDDLTKSLLVESLSIEAKVRRAGKGKRLVIENGAEAEVAGLAAMIGEAFAIRNQLLSGSHDSIEAMSGRLGMNKSRLTSLVRLSYLRPEIVRALLAGSQSNALTPRRLLRLSKDLPHDWKEQRRFLGFAA
jgi:hypothetical protein